MGFKFIWKIPWNICIASRFQFQKLDFCWQSKWWRMTRVWLKSKFFVAEEIKLVANKKYSEFPLSSQRSNFLWLPICSKTFQIVVLIKIKFSNSFQFFVFLLKMNKAVAEIFFIGFKTLKKSDFNLNSQSWGCFSFREM